MIAEAAVAVGRRLSRNAPAGATDYWAARLWDREEATEHPVLGSFYEQEAQSLTEQIGLAVAAADGPLRALDLCCGTGRFTLALLEAGADAVLSVDVSRLALERTSARVDKDDRHSTQLADVWTLDPTAIGRFDLVVCVDAIHHLGPVPAVLELISNFIRPGGTLIGNLWTRDNFHEFARARHGRFRHGVQSLAYAAAAVSASVRQTQPAPVRTNFVSAAEGRELIADRFGGAVTFTESRYWLNFTARAIG